MEKKDITIIKDNLIKAGYIINLLIFKYSKKVTVCKSKNKKNENK